MKQLLSKPNAKRIIGFVLTFIVMCSSVCPMLFAVSVSADALVGKILAFIVKIFFYIGCILLLWSIGQLVLAFKNDDADSKSKAAMLMVVSIILICIRPVFNALDIIQIDDMGDISTNIGAKTDEG